MDDELETFAGDDAEVVAYADGETLVGEWRQSPSGPRLDESTELYVNMPTKRNLDAWCFAEYMDTPVLLQVT